MAMGDSVIFELSNRYLGKLSRWIIATLLLSMLSTLSSAWLPGQSAFALPAKVQAQTASLNASTTSNGLFGIFKNEDWGSNTSATPPVSITPTESCGSMVVPLLNYNWTNTRPNNGVTTLNNCGTVNGTAIEKYSAMFTGYLLAPVTGTLDFYSSSDDGFVLNIGGSQSVINDYQTHGSLINPFNASGSFNVTAGNIYPIQIFYHQQSAGAAIGLYWTLNASCLSGASAISSATCNSSAVVIPQSNLATSAMAFGTGCVIGSSQSCPATSASEIKSVTGTNTNGLYWITVGYTVEKVYCLMDSNLDGGGWMLTMKGSSNNQSASTALNYGSSYWTNATTLNPADVGPLLSNSGVPSCSTGSSAAAACPTQNYDENAKFDTFANTTANQFLINYPDIPTSNGGGRFPSSNSYGFMWEERLDQTTAIGTNNTNPGGLNLSSYTYSNGSGCPTASTTLTYLFTNSYRCAIRQVQYTYNSSESPYSVIGNGVFSSQIYIGFLAINYGGGNSKSTRIGLGFNENGTYDETSNDVVGGVGLGSSPGTYQAGDYIGCCTTNAQAGLNRKMGYEMYVRNLSSLSASSTYLQTPAGTSLTQITTSVTSQKNGSGTSVVSYSLAPTTNSGLNLSGISVNSTGVVTVGATTAPGSYALTMESTDTAGSVSAINLTVVVTPSGPIDYAGTFNAASSQYAEAGNRPIPTGASNFTVEAWIYATTLPASGWSEAISQGGGSAYGFDMGLNSSGQIRLGDQWTGSVVNASNFTLLAGQWYHVAVTHSSANVGQLFVNGSLVDLSSSYSLQTTNTGQNLRIGTQYNNGSTPYNEYWNGKVDEVKIYNSVLSQADIKGDMSTYGVYDSAVAGNLVDYFDFNEGSGSTFYNRVSGAASASNLVLQSAAPTWSDVKSSTIANGVGIVSFPRSYLTAVGGYTTPSGITQVSYLAVAGGGSGGCGTTSNDYAGGGGGAGGLLVGTTTLAASTVYPVTIGSGGIATSSSGAFSNCTNAGTNGTNTVFAALTATGGGGGGSGLSSSPYYVAAGSGGSGGGGDAQVSGGSAGTGISGQGYAGGLGLNNSSNAQLQGGGGGGGAGGAGATPTINPACSTSYVRGGAGGVGVQSSISGTTKYYAAGGGGANRYATGACGGAGGSSIGGGGASLDASTQQAGNGAAGTGSGGGGTANTPFYAGRGGSGILILAYVVAAPIITTQPVNTVTTAGLTATFTDTNTAVSGLTRTYQWQYYSSSTQVWANVTNGTTDSVTGNYTTPTTTVSMSGYYYRVAITDTDGSTGSNSGASLTTYSNAVILSVNPEQITITANAVTKNFGSSDPALTGFSVSGSPGLFNGDTLTVTETRTVGENAGTYWITPSAASFTPAGDAANYSITYTSNTLTIVPYGTLTITPVMPPTLTYNGLPQSFTKSATITGNASFDTITVNSYSIFGAAYANGADSTGAGVSFASSTSAFPTSAGGYVLTPSSVSYTLSGGIGNYAHAYYTPLNFNVIRAARTDTVTVASPSMSYQGTDQISVAFSAGSGDGNIFYTSTTPSYCSVNSSGLVTMLIGNPSDTCTVTVSPQAGINYLGVASSNISITPMRINQGILFSATSYGTVGFPLVPNVQGGNGIGPITYQLVSPGTAGCQAIGGSITAASAGSCSITALKAQDDNYYQTSIVLVLNFYLYVNRMPAPIVSATPSQIGGGVSGGGIKFNQTNGTVITVTGVSPTSGASGTQITLTGTGFKNNGVSTIQAVSFNSGLDFVPFVVNSATQITLTLPSGESGVVDQFAIQPINGATVYSPTFTGL